MGFRGKIGGLMGKWRFPGFGVENRDFLGCMVKNWDFGGKIGIFLKNGVFVGF